MHSALRSIVCKNCTAGRCKENGCKNYQHHQSWRNVSPTVASFLGRHGSWVWRCSLSLWYALAQLRFCATVVLFAENRNRPVFEWERPTSSWTGWPPVAGRPGIFSLSHSSPVHIEQKPTSESLPCETPLVWDATTKLQCCTFFQCCTALSEISSAFPDASLSTKKNYVSVVTSLVAEFNHRFQDFSSIEKYIKLFSTPFLVDAQEVEESLQLALIKLQCDDSLKTQHQLLCLPDFYHGLEDAKFPLMNYMQKWSACSAQHTYMRANFFSLKL